MRSNRASCSTVEARMLPKLMITILTNVATQKANAMRGVDSKIIVKIRIVLDFVQKIHGISNFEKHRGSEQADYLTTSICFSPIGLQKIKKAADLSWLRPLV